MMLKEIIFAIAIFGTVKSQSHDEEKEGIFKNPISDQFDRLKSLFSDMGFGNGPAGRAILPSHFKRNENSITIPANRFTQLVNQISEDERNLNQDSQNSQRYHNKISEIQNPKPSTFDFNPEATTAAPRYRNDRRKAKVSSYPNNYQSDVRISERQYPDNKQHSSSQSTARGRSPQRVKLIPVNIPQDHRNVGQLNPDGQRFILSAVNNEKKSHAFSQDLSPSQQRPNDLSVSRPNSHQPTHDTTNYRLNQGINVLPNHGSFQENASAFQYFHPDNGRTQTSNSGSYQPSSHPNEYTGNQIPFALGNPTFDQNGNIYGNNNDQQNYVLTKDAQDALRNIFQQHPDMQLGPPQVLFLDGSQQKPFSNQQYQQQSFQSHPNLNYQLIPQHRGVPIETSNLNNPPLNNPPQFNFNTLNQASVNLLPQDYSASNNHNPNNAIPQNYQLIQLPHSHVSGQLQNKDALTNQNQGPINYSPDIGNQNYPINHSPDIDTQNHHINHSPNIGTQNHPINYSPNVVYQNHPINHSPNVGIQNRPIHPSSNSDTQDRQFAHPVVRKYIQNDNVVAYQSFGIAPQQNHEPTNTIQQQLPGNENYHQNQEGHQQQSQRHPQDFASHQNGFTKTSRRTNRPRKFQSSVSQEQRNALGQSHNKELSREKRLPSHQISGYHQQTNNNDNNNQHSQQPYPMNDNRIHQRNERKSRSDDPDVQKKSKLRQDTLKRRTVKLDTDSLKRNDSENEVLSEKR